MYDILQLNDMLVPELLDIAEQLKIPNAKKLNKQDLVYKILDGQAVKASEKKSDGEDKHKRKRIIKTSTSLSTEEAIVEEPDNDNSMAKSSRIGGPKPALKKPARVTEETPSAEEKHPKRGRKKGDEPVADPLPVEVIMPEEEIASASNMEEENTTAVAPGPVATDPNIAQKFYPQRRDQAFNIEF
ncbi:MAG TPA: Rho termination factor N-terminal domain-containing protein, partial [Chitinophagaceae bacterium]